MGEIRINKLIEMTRKIGVRLRLVFLSLGIIIAIAGVTAVLQTKTILKAHGQLTQTALPMLTVAQQTEKNLNAMFLMLENLGEYRTDSALNTARYEIKEKTENVRLNLTTLRKVDVSGQVITSLDQRLDIVEASSLRVLREKSALLAVREDIQFSLAQISTLQEQSHESLDQFAFEFATKLEALVRTVENDSNLSNNSRINQIEALFVASLNVNTISFSLDSVILMIRNQAQTNQHATAARVRSKIDTKLRDIINRLTQLPNDPARRDLAEYMSTLRDIVAKDAGIFARLELEQSFQDELDENRIAHLQLNAEISNMSTALVSKTLLLVDTTSSQLGSAVNQLIWVILIAFVTLSITVAMTNQIVVDKQFNQRIRDLNQSVSAIASGDLDHSISVSGRDELGDMARALVTFRENAEDLQRSNVELEKFAYVAAHDLRSPLQAIHDLSTWAIEDEDSQLSVECQDYLSLLQERVVRLKRLLNDLLSYARVSQSEPEPEVLNLAQIVLEYAHFADPEDKYKIRYLGCIPDIVAQLTPLQQIIGNLLNNAVKHHDKPRGEITVNGKVEMGQLVLTVTDDGPGIETQYHKRVFELFQTLQPRDQVEGSGMGLAIIKKIVSGQKGKIEMKSDPSKQRGTRFTISLPMPHFPTVTPKQYPAVAA
jgi:signal transduction histidine kinase